MNKTLGIIGLGNMAWAIFKGMKSSSKNLFDTVTVYDIDDAKSQDFVKLGAIKADSIEEVVKSSKFIMLCVKPQVMSEVLEEAAFSVGKQNVVVSIAAGISFAFIKSKLGEKTKTVLCMPNTPLMLGYGATAMSKSSEVSQPEFNLVKKMFSCSGIVEEIQPDKMLDVIAVSGSTPAFIYFFADCFCKYADAQGIPYDQAMKLFAQTLIGSAHMLTGSGMSAEDLIKMVCSPGGTTLKGMEALKAEDFDEIIYKCCRATAKRARELGN